MNRPTLAAAPLKDFFNSDEPVGLFAFEDAGLAAPFLSNAVRKELAAALKDESFEGKKGETVSVRVSDGQKQRRFIVVGLGKKKGFGIDCQRKAGAALAQTVRSRFPAVWISAPGELQAAAEGILLSSYEYSRYKEPNKNVKLASLKFIVRSAAEGKKAQAVLDKAAVYAEAVCWARDLVNDAPSDKTPASIAKLAKAFAKDGVTLKVIEKKEAESLGMGSYLGVARGSSELPYFLHLTYTPKAKTSKKIALVGKGVTFDSGGLSLKPPAAMETMKDDMAGAAAVLAVFKVISRLGVKAEVHGITPFTYNMPGPDAIKPGDVVKAMNGKTIEVLNTDAEGRLILADALVYASRLKPTAIIDLATLTGAAIVAVGSEITAAMASDKALLAKLNAAAKRSSEMIWELPLVENYRQDIKSKIADLKNIGKAGQAGTIIGGLFLQEFVEGAPWVHLDIAGPAYSESGSAYSPAGATGAPVRTLLEYLREL